MSSNDELAREIVIQLECGRCLAPRVFIGKVAMFRLTSGDARYTSDFSPFPLFPKS